MLGKTYPVCGAKISKRWWLTGSAMSKYKCFKCDSTLVCSSKRLFKNFMANTIGLMIVSIGIRPLLVAKVAEPYLRFLLAATFCTIIIIGLWILFELILPNDIEIIRDKNGGINV